jgi:release factor glutamine methyltransferase
MRVYTLRNHLEIAELALNTGPHPERARLDSELLLMNLLGKDRAWLIAHPRKEISAEKQDQYEALIRRRSAGEPIQYITAEAEFYGLPFRVTPDVLIPRPETEHLVERVIQLVGAPSFPRSVREGWETRSLRILDIGTGSGAIAVALAHNLPHDSFTATDISESALSVARGNADRNGVTNQIRFLHGDLLAPVSTEKFDIIVSNPPYVASTDRNTLAVEVRDYEPALALFAGDNGLDIYRSLIPAAFESLVPGGFLLLEIGYGQQPAIHDLLSNTGFQNINVHPDLQNIPRVAVAAR